LSRSDRFLCLYLQLSLVTLFSFLILRNIDKPFPAIVDGQLTEVSADYDFKSLISSALISLALSFLMLPVPRFMTRRIEQRYWVEEEQDGGEETFKDDLSLYDESRSRISN
jgi:hypothetical protein